MSLNITVCEEGQRFLLDSNDFEEGDLAIEGPSSGENPGDALSGSGGDGLDLCEPDVFIVKSLCAEGEAILLSVSLSTANVASVEMEFFDSVGNPLPENPMVK